MDAFAKFSDQIKFSLARQAFSTKMNIHLLKMSRDLAIFAEEIKEMEREDKSEELIGGLLVQFMKIDAIMTKLRETK